MRILPYACQHVAVLYIKHGLSIVTCFLGGVGVVVANNQALCVMNMLESLNTLVSINTSFCSLTWLAPAPRGSPGIKSSDATSDKWRNTFQFYSCGIYPRCSILGPPAASSNEEST